MQVDGEQLQLQLLGLLCVGARDTRPGSAGPLRNKGPGKPRPRPGEGHWERQQETRMRRKRDFSVDFDVLGMGGGQISGTLSGGTSSGCFCVSAFVRQQEVDL